MQMLLRPSAFQIDAGIAQNVLFYTYEYIYKSNSQFFMSIVDKKVKLSLWQAVGAHRVVRRRGSHIF
jgi:hypothetical protein